MDFHLLSDVRDQDGNRLGELRHIVLDQESRRIVSLVVQEAAPAGHAVVVPVDAVDSADDDAVYLRLSPQELHQLPPYAVAENAAPPPADIYPGNRSSDQVQEPIDVPDVAPVGAAQGITSIAFTPIFDVIRNIPDGTIIIDDGTPVWASDGELGKVERLLTGETVDQVTAMVVETGSFFTHPLGVPVDQIASITGDRVTLSLSKADLEAANDE